LLLTGYRGDELREMLENVTEAIYEKNMSTAYILRTMGSYSPAFGMVGTLVGLIIMLDNLGGDSSKLGKGLAVALLTTLYGVLMSHLIFKPAAEKIQQKEELIKFRNMLLTEGFVLLSESQDSITIQDKLNSFLDPENHFNVVKK
jgi:chemotaxis protein MotA